MIRSSSLPVEVEAAHMRLRAATTRPYNGLPNQTGHVIERCRVYHRPTSALLIFCRDEGMHACGWFKNPDWDRCRHLSLSFCTLAGEAMDHDHTTARRWVDALFGDDARYLWIESPYSQEGKERGVFHYRVMCDATWAPIVPRGEPYSKDFTDKGWKSWSDQQAEREAKGEPLVEGTPP